LTVMVAFLLFVAIRKLERSRLIELSEL
jgi:hypothetical protein